MTEEVMSRSFEPFFTTKEPGKGTGLGLSTVYGIVKQSGGYITVESEPGRGTGFEIFFPMVVGSAAEPAASHPASGLARRGETILVVEDNSAVRGLVVKALGGYGYRVLSAEHGDAAIRLVEQHHEPIHLLVTDVVMPGMSGRELAARLTAMVPRLKVLCISGYSEEAMSAEGELLPGIILLRKPFTPAALSQKVRELLDEDGPGSVTAGR
jgi:CheY-like chemotaxis protein